jgi:DNA repair exonuclease SbcCD ATPase subunit
MRIVHLSDLHIRNYKYFKEFDETLDNLFESLRNVNPDLILFLGDLFHTKNYISGEAISLAKKFLSGLAEIAPTKLILGNHDINANNIHRTSPVVPICEMIDNVEVYFNSGVYDYTDGDIPLTFVAYSLVDVEKFSLKKSHLNKKRVNIGLGHFCIGGSENSSGFVFTNNSSHLSDEHFESFEHLDYFMLGDIHQQQYLDDCNKVAFAGSLLQNNFGESTKKGFLVWDIYGKDKFNVHFEELDSPLRFYTVEIKNSKRLPKGFSPPIGSRIRISINENISFSDVAALKTRVISRFKPKDIREVYGTSIGGSYGFSIDDLKIELDNVRNSNVQSALIRGFFKDREDVPKDILNEAIKFNSELDSQIAVDSVVRNIVWDFNTFKFDNYFNYGEGNVIDFSKLSGKIVLIGGSNAVGKSGIGDSSIHTMFNTTKRNITKNYDYVNSRKTFANGRLELSLGDRRYFIERSIHKSKDTKTSRTDLSFSCIDSNGKKYNLNGEQRFDTEKNIRSVFGSSDDLFISSFSSQGDITSFVEKGSTARKEVLMKFLDLYFFEQKYDLVMERSKGIRARLKDNEEVDFDDYIDEYEVLAEELTDKLEFLELEYNNKTKASFALERERAELKASLEDIEVIDIEQVRKEIQSVLSNIALYKKELVDLEKELRTLNDSRNKILSLCEKVDIDEIKKRNTENNVAVEEKKDILGNIKHRESLLKQLKRSSNVLMSSSCEGKGKYAKCPLISEATKARDKIPEIERGIHLDNKRLDVVNKILKKNVDGGIVAKLDKVNLILEKRRNIEIKTSSTETLIANKKGELLKLSPIISGLIAEEEKYIHSVEQKEKNKASFQRLVIVENNLSEINVELKKSSEQISALNKDLGSKTTMMNEWIGKKNEYIELTKKYSMYNVLLECFGKSGIPHKILTDKLPIINATINSLLDDVVTFRVELSHDEGNSISVNLLYPDSVSRPLSIASGMEKMISSLAIRAGLCLISNLPRSSTFIIDEGFGALDKDRVIDLEEMLQKLKQHFVSIIIITHVSELKDIAETIIDISTDKDHNAYINV